MLVTMPVVEPDVEDAAAFLGLAGAAALERRLPNTLAARRDRAEFGLPLGSLYCGRPMLMAAASAPPASGESAGEPFGGLTRGTAPVGGFFRPPPSRFEPFDPARPRFFFRSR